VPTKLELGFFTVEPASGTIEPGKKVEVAVNFKAEGAQQSCEVIGLDVRHRDFQDNPTGIQYEVVAESCIPGGQGCLGHLL
jgi:hypothetical protein